MKKNQTEETKTKEEENEEKNDERKDEKRDENKEEKADENKETCDISCAEPPGPDNPLPKYGELYKQRELEKSGRMNKEAAHEEYLNKKREQCRKKPMQEKCIPKEIMLPFKKQSENMGRYLEADAPSTRHGRLQGVRIRRRPLQYPGWLIDLSNDQLQNALDAKMLLSTGKPLCEIMDNLCETISGLGVTISEEDVREIMRRVPVTSKGWSFSHFMFIAGNPVYARKKGVLQEPLPSELVTCDDDSKPSGGDRKGVVDRLYQPPKTVVSDEWPPQADKRKADENGAEYSEREKAFYSALLYCEMYETMEEVHKLYFQGISIPECKDKESKEQTGFGVSDIGTRKLGFAAWDRPLPPLPKLSPYLADLPLVVRRKVILKPNGNLQFNRRSRTTIKPMFLAVRGPEKPKDTIKVMEDGRRIVSILEVLSSQGNCLAMLPDVQYILHYSDTLLGKSVEVKTQEGPLPEDEPRKIYESRELDWITSEAKHLYRPHGLPPQIAKIPTLISYTDAIKLREVCKEIREQQWEYINTRKIEFREKAWQLMHVDKIKCGNLRESFAYSFQIYLPYKSNFPIVINNSSPW